MMLPAGQLAITPSLGKNSGATLLLMLPGAGFAASLNLKQTLSLQFGQQASGESGVCLQPFFPSYTSQINTVTALATARVPPRVGGC